MSVKVGSTQKKRKEWGLGGYKSGDCRRRKTGPTEDILVEHV
jgi:hypothetical protein